jgi:hypothetical protein
MIAFCRRLGLLATLATALCGLFITTATAAPYSNAPLLSTTEASTCAEQVVTVHGVGFTPGTVVVRVIGHGVLVSAEAGLSGDFSVTGTLPHGLSGAVTLEATGPRTASGDGAPETATTVLSVDAACVGADSANRGGAAPTGASGAGADPASAGDGGLSSTGVAVFGLVGLGLILFVSGIVLLVGVRRRPTA